jgi:metal-responsive CopG/Arc/MetJ family transcriptional regulator
MTTLTFRKDPRIRTTISLPSSLLDRGQRFVDNGVVSNRTSLIELALERLLADLEEAETDRQFAAMAGDHSYRALNVTIEREFAESDWEALAEGEERREG